MSPGVADKGLWDSIWVYDHFHTIPTPELMTTFECWTITATLARDTERVKVGQMVGCNGYRNPALYAKIASTVDVASHHRLYAGIGAGWYEQEWKAYGYEWTDTPIRMGGSGRRCRSSIRCGPRTTPSSQGRHYTIDKPINEPKDAGAGQDPVVDRGWRRAGHAQAGRPVWRCLQLRRRQRDDPAQTGCPARPLRQGRPQLRRDHQVQPDPDPPDRAGRGSREGRPRHTAATTTRGSDIRARCWSGRSTRSGARSSG